MAQTLLMLRPIAASASIAAAIANSLRLKTPAGLGWRVFCFDREEKP
jgi:hypothetical protein